MTARSPHPRAEATPAVVGVVTTSARVDQARHLTFAAVNKAGALPELWTDATALSKLAAADVLVLVLGADPAELHPVAASLGEEPRTIDIPRILLVDDGVTVSTLAPFGCATLVSTGATEEELVFAMRAALAKANARAALEHAATASGAALRQLQDALSKIQRDLAALSHDTRALLGVILGFAANLRDGIDGAVTEEQRRHLQNVVEATSDAVALLDHYGKAVQETAARAVESVPPPSTHAVTRRHVDVSELVRTTVALFGALAAQRRLRLHADADRAIYAWCDPMQVKQALVNLVGNALKYTPPGGTVTVSTQLGAPASTRGGSTERRDLEIVVSDNGVGIPPLDRGRVFDRGVRLERDAGTPGSGEGLAIVRDIVEAHGGTVRAEDGLSGGTSIVMVLPTDRRTRGGAEGAYARGEAK